MFHVSALQVSTPLPLRTRTSRSEPDIREKEVDFFSRQAQLQAEARMALAQAKEMARMQMEIEKQSKKKSPIADIVRASFNKVSDKTRFYDLVEKGRYNFFYFCSMAGKKMPERLLYFS